MPGAARAILDDPDLFLHGLDVARDAARFVRMNRQAFAASTMLDERIRRAAPGGLEVSLRELARGIPAKTLRRRSRFVFHTGHTCSTLLARAVGELPGSLVLREPLVMRELARVLESRQSARLTARDGVLLDAVLAVLAKTYRAADTAVIKPSSLANGAMRAVLAGRPARRAVFLYSALPSFLATMLRSPDNRADGMVDLALRLRAPGTRLTRALVSRQPIARRLAALWILHMDLFLELLPTVPASRLRSLDAADFLAAPDHALSELARMFGFAWSSADVTRVTLGPVFTTYAKSPERRYGRATRRRELASALHAYADQIEDATAWAARITRARPIPQPLPRGIAAAGKA